MMSRDYEFWYKAFLVTLAIGSFFLGWFLADIYKMVFN